MSPTPEPSTARPARPPVISLGGDWLLVHFAEGRHLPGSLPALPRPFTLEAAHG